MGAFRGGQRTRLITCSDPFGGNRRFQPPSSRPSDKGFQGCTSTFLATPSLTLLYRTSTNALFKYAAFYFLLQSQISDGSILKYIFPTLESRCREFQACFTEILFGNWGPVPGALKAWRPPSKNLRNLGMVLDESATSQNPASGRWFGLKSSFITFWVSFWRSLFGLLSFWHSLLSFWLPSSLSELPPLF